MGRHFRLSPQAKVIVARDHEENEFLQYLHPKGTALLTGTNFAGPTALLVGPVLTEYLDQSGALILRYAQKPLPPSCEIQSEENGQMGNFTVTSEATETFVDSLRIV